MHYYKFNIADYRKDTGHLCTIEHGIYRQLIDWQYLDEQPIPLETQVVMRRLRLGSDDEKFLANVLSEFFEKTEKGYIQLRVSMELKGYQENAEKNKNNGKLGGRPKKTHPVILGNPNETQLKGNHKPLTINHKPINTNTPPDGFEEFWKAYPKKSAKPLAMKAFKSANINGDLRKVLADIESKKQSDSWKTNGGKFIPMPSSYLNQRRWEDEVEQELSDYEKMVRGGR